MKPLPFREVKRKLEGAGFVEVSQTGSHVKFAKTAAEGTRTAAVPQGSCHRNDSQHLTPSGIERD